MLTEPIKSVVTRTPERLVEIGWFDDLCGGDTQYLGVLDHSRRSNYDHCRNIMLTAEQKGFGNILLPTSYLVGQEVIPFAAAMAPQTTSINMLTAVRTGEIFPIMLARHIATLDHILKGRLTINIINSALPGMDESPELRYKRCSETIEILKQAWMHESIDFEGEIYQVKLTSTDPVKPYQQNGGPLLYFGGISSGSKQVCAKYCDVFLMWPEPEESIYATMQDMSDRAAEYNRQIDFGLRVHVIVRETEDEARTYAQKIMSKFDPERFNLKQRTQDHQSLGVLRQDEFRAKSTDDYLEPFLWGGIGRARSGCGAALVGTPDQILWKMNRYMDMGIRAFILSGYPLIEECELFGKYVLPHLPTVKLSVLQGRTPQDLPTTPLTTAVLR
ncbi:LLM class flavin-dependent oxidoreductase [Aetokthonos hydrillicola Thurmond2011]|jgi:alkanesulfonate monooxygenase|uniref:LLM class flavin-dependent oxidoreductase n=1 Tax=Aetokthonos hydrillicola Thurmond2011 TaxID=2712845 RepID=A0AAP5ME21_9CYAN|nr:LLM class flavin-dependent oxidoreductase [Aetokthonos hydrillicola]MBO3461364.1 LLM class flavin-dependent oxidoreductase [Aetokthonos hydrillicola CCALA 1050]MBW4589239.1 LLM class flavin-dependent oxidoreductase [Aetokthonos hydrillicola CCALA 1050]MDR9900423.1 LLM class flavin-dependent oxidoreductase [Aetokthonos hydrillicola Thurmond2011]